LSNVIIAVLKISAAKIQIFLFTQLIGFKENRTDEDADRMVEICTRERHTRQGLTTPLRSPVQQKRQNKTTDCTETKLLWNKYFLFSV